MMKDFCAFVGAVVSIAIGTFGLVVPAVHTFYTKVVTPYYYGEPAPAPGTQTLGIPVGWECAQMEANYILCRPIRGLEQQGEAVTGTVVAQ